MKDLLNLVDGIDDITHVVIENQISPIANRMKTIQGMLAQYFIMKNTHIEIEFVSSIHKLKQFENIEKSEKNTMIQEKTVTQEKTVADENQKEKYKQHKKDGVFYCSQIIENNPGLHSFRESLKTKKKDDLADSFLQGIWYLKHKNIIMNADDLKINIV
jgi:hypothetical protein